MQAIEYIHSRTTTMALISCLLLLCFVGSGYSHNEIFQNYLRSEKSFISDLESFIDKQESVLQLLRKKLLNFKVEHSEAVENFDEYFSNELNKFLLIKRLALDVDRLSDKTFEVANEFRSNVNAFRNGHVLPSENDLMRSAMSIAVLQKTQNLRTDKLAKGIFGNVKRRWIIW